MILNATLLFYGSILAVPAACWRLARGAHRAQAPHIILLYILPLGIYAALVAAAAAMGINGQWTWLGESIKATPFQDFQNNLFWFGLVWFSFPAGYGGLGLGILIYAALATRKRTVQNPEQAAGSDSRKKTRN